LHRVGGTSADSEKEGVAWYQRDSGRANNCRQWRNRSVATLLRRYHMTLWLGVFLCLTTTVHPTGASEVPGAGSCVNAAHSTLADGLREEAEVNRRAANLATGYARSMAMFGGWNAIPSDVRIIGGPTHVEIVDTAQLRTLPSPNSAYYGNLLAGNSVQADCIVIDHQEEWWVVLHNQNGSKAYIDSKSTDLR
jgi:hypothetical protein